MTETAPFVLPAPRFETRGPFVVAGLRERYRFADGDFTGPIGAQWTRFAPRLGTIPDAVPGVAYGLFFSRIEGLDGFEYRCGVEVVADAAPGDLVIARVPALRYAVFPHERRVTEFRSTIDAIYFDWLPNSDYAMAQVDGAPDIVERYGPGYDPASGAGDIEFWIPVVPT